jgi:hypothetical protein
MMDKRLLNENINLIRLNKILDLLSLYKVVENALEKSDDVLRCFCMKPNKNAAEKSVGYFNELRNDLTLLGVSIATAGIDENEKNGYKELVDAYKDAPWYKKLIKGDMDVGVEEGEPLINFSDFVVHAANICCEELGYKIDELSKLVKK